MIVLDSEWLRHVRTAACIDTRIDRNVVQLKSKMATLSCGWLIFSMCFLELDAKSPDLQDMFLYRLLRSVTTFQSDLKFKLATLTSDWPTHLWFLLQNQWIISHPEGVMLFFRTILYQRWLWLLIISKFSPLIFTHSNIYYQVTNWETNILLLISMCVIMSCYIDITDRPLWQILDRHTYYRGLVFLKKDFSSHLASQTSPSMQNCSEKSIITKQINDSTSIYYIYWQKQFLWDNEAWLY